MFQTITVDNGSEFADFAEVERWGTKFYYAYPYTTWERPQNERHNGMLRRYIHKGVFIEKYNDEDIFKIVDTPSRISRMKLDYCTPEELFDVFLDIIYAAESPTTATFD